MSKLKKTAVADTLKVQKTAVADTPKPEHWPMYTTLEIFRRENTHCNEGTYRKEFVMNNWKAKLKKEWNDNPVGVIVVGALAVTAAAKIIDALSAAQGRRAYARQVDYRVRYPHK